jgi:hypothetical protein
MKAVAARDGVAADLVPCPGRIGEAEHGLVCVELRHLGIGNLELNHGAGLEPGLDYVLDDLGLGVNRHPAATGQITEIQMVPLTFELQVDPAVFEAFGVHPGSEADGAEQLHGAGLEQPRPLPCLAVGPAPVLDHDRVDAAQGQQVRKQQPRWPGPDDAYLGT